MLDLAFAEWKKVPCGIYNGPDCWSSHLAGSAEGWTQFNMFNRVIPCPMSPIISWQAFTMLKIAEAKKVARKG